MLLYLLHLNIEALYVAVYLVATHSDEHRYIQRFYIYLFIVHLSEQLLARPLHTIEALYVAV